MMNLTKSFHWTARAALALAATCSAVLSAGVPEESHELEACTLQCASGQGVGCPSNEHKTWEHATQKDVSGNLHPTECRTGPCNQEGHQCTPLPDGPAADLGFVASVIEAVETQDHRSLAEMLDVEAVNVTLNRERAAVQVLTCTGDVSAHLPLTREFLAKVDGEMTTR